MSTNIEEQIPKLKIRQIEIRTHAHATEDINKVNSVLLSLVPEYIAAKSIKVAKMTGTYGQLITDLRLFLKKQADIKAFLNLLSNSLSVEDKQNLKRELSNRLDDKFKFYFRLEKQALTQNKVKLAKSRDVVQIIIANLNQSPMIKTKPEHISNFYQSLNII